MKKLEDYYWICPEPFSGLGTSSSGQFRPCCLISEKIRELPEEEKCYSNTHSFKSFHDSKFMKRLKNAMKNGGDDDCLNTYCSKCVHMEKVGVTSHRQMYLNKFDNKFADKKHELETIIHEDILPTFIHTVQLNNLSGNYCNLTCNMCSEVFSSSILNEKIKLNEPISIVQVNNSKKIKTVIKQDNCEEFTNELQHLLNNSLEIKFSGGEPLLSKENYKLLELCDNENTIIKVSTNGTIDPTKFITLCKKFKTVKVDISIEGVRNVHEYIRYPSKWNAIVNNYKKLILSNIKPTFVTTINALNVGRLHEILEVLPENKVSFSSLVTNNFYSLNSIPPDIKEVYLKRLIAFKHFKQKQTLIDYLNNTEYNEQDMVKMIQHIKRRDGIRGTNLLSVFPEWTSYYERY
jgi:organic radical activating enzyme